MSVHLVSKISNLCDHNPPTSQTDGRTDGQTDDMRSQYRAMHIVHCAVKMKKAKQSTGYESKFCDSRRTVAACSTSTAMVINSQVSMYVDEVDPQLLVFQS